MTLPDSLMKRIDSITPDISDEDLQAVIMDSAAAYDHQSVGIAFIFQKIKRRSGIGIDTIRQLYKSGRRVQAGSLDDGVPNYHDHTKRGFTPQ